MNICVTQQLLFTEFSSLDLLPQNDTPKSALSMTAGLFFYLLSDKKKRYAADNFTNCFNKQLRPQKQERPPKIYI